MNIRKSKIYISKKTCGFGGHQVRRRDCSLESPSSKRGFLTSNIPLEEYLKVYSECDGIRSENRKCSERVCTLGMVLKFA